MAYKHPWAKHKQLADLHPYQRQMANFAIEHAKCGLFLPMGAGKAVDDNTPIPTVHGIRRVGDILPGDKIFGRDGTPTTVTATYHHKDKDAYKMLLADGRTLTCCDEHLVAYQEINDTEIHVAPLGELMETYLVNPVRLPDNGPVDWPEQQHDETLSDLIDRLCETDKSGHDAHIKKDRLIDCAANRMRLLRALVERIGTATVRQSAENNLDRYQTQIAMTLQSKGLAEDIAWLARSLGYDATVENNDKHHVTTVFSHVAILDDNGVTSRAVTGEGRTIVDIQAVGTRDMTCFTVDAPDHLYLVGDFIVTHNTLTTLEVLWELDPKCQTLIVGPKPVVRATWNDEIEKWKFPLRVRSLIEDEKGRALKPDARHELYREVCESKTASIWLVNREMICDLVNNLPQKRVNGKQVCDWPFRMVILDEAQAFKNPASKRFKALASVYDQTVRLIELTGTPSPNGLEDIWSLIWLLDRGERLGPNITSYRRSYFFPTGTSANGMPIRWVPFKWAEKEIREKIADITVSLPDVQNKLPDAIYMDHPVQLDNAERKLYKELMKESVLEFCDGDEVVAANAAVLQAKLSQLASGAIYVNGTSEYKVIHMRKIDETLRIIEQAGGPVIVAYHFKSDREMLLERLRQALDPKRKKNAEPLPANDPKSNVQAFDGSPEMVRRWNERKIPVMLIQPASAGHGLNLQHGGSTLIWYTLSWNLEHYLQTNARLHRQGQTETVFIHRLLTENTVDGRIASALERKNVTQQALLDAISATINDD